MSLNISAHNVESVSITQPMEFESGGKKHVSRYLTFIYSDGSKEQITLISSPDCQSIPIEVAK